MLIPIDGSEVYSSKIEKSITEIDMSKFISGNYIVKIITPNNVLSRKILKQ